MAVDPRSKLVYLAGPIDLVDRDTAQGWRTRAAALLAERGFGVFSPAHAFELPNQISPTTAKTVLAINFAALHMCGAILANLDGPGYGTPIEFHSAIMGGKLAVSFGGNESSLFVKTWPHSKSLKKAVKSLAKQYDR